MIKKIQASFYAGTYIALKKMINRATVKYNLLTGEQIPAVHDYHNTNHNSSDTRSFTDDRGTGSAAGCDSRQAIVLPTLPPAGRGSRLN